MNKKIENYGEKREILPESLKISHFIIACLDKYEFFSRQNSIEAWNFISIS